MVVRCGDKSLHKHWGAPARTWDLAVSYYGTTDDAFPEADYVHRYKGGKWDGIASFFAENPDCLEKYEYVWFPDDDILTENSAVVALFEAARTFKLDLCQPALSEQSYFSHLITLCDPSFRLRYTNFVELMVPVFSRSLLRKAQPQFQSTRTGFGLDFLWPRLIEDPINKIAVIDSVTVTHTRPVGGELHQSLTPGMLNGTRELERDLSAARVTGNSRVNGVSVPSIYPHSGVTSDARFVQSRVVLATMQARSYFARRKNATQPIKTIAIVRYFIKLIMQRG